MKIKISKSQWEEMGKKAEWSNKWKEPDPPEKEPLKQLAIDKINIGLKMLTHEELKNVYHYISNEFFSRFHTESFPKPGSKYELLTPKKE